MNLSQIPNGEPVLIDANIILYAIRNASGQCTQLLRRCADGQVIGIVATHILAEVMHRLMMAEARENGWITAANPTRQLSQQPERVKMLSRYEQAVRNLLAIGIQVEPVEKEDIVAALRVQREAGLLTNDALLAAVAQRLRAMGIASADQSFSRVQGIIHYSPDDVQV